MTPRDVIPFPARPRSAAELGVDLWTVAVALDDVAAALRQLDRPNLVAAVETIRRYAASCAADAPSEEGRAA